MGHTNEEIQKAVKQYVLDEFLPGEDPEELTSTTPLISGGIIDSVSALKLVSYVEETYDIELAAHEADTDNLDTLESISNLVASKL